MSETHFDYNMGLKSVMNHCVCLLAVLRSQLSLTSGFPASRAFPGDSLLRRTLINGPGFRAILVAREVDDRVVEASIEELIGSVTGYRDQFLVEQLCICRLISACKAGHHIALTGWIEHEGVAVQVLMKIGAQHQVIRNVVDAR